MSTNKKKFLFSPISQLFTFLILFYLCYAIPTQVFDYSHEEGSPLEFNAGKLSSNMGVIPFAYNRLDICGSQSMAKAEDTLGEILTGERLYITGYQAQTNKNGYCSELCYNSFSEASIKRITYLIKRHYFVNWYLDKLPAGLVIFDPESKNAHIDYTKKIPLGYEENGVYYIYNHLQFRVLLNKVSDNKYNIVGFNILPISIKHDRQEARCAKNENDLLLNFDQERQPLNGDNILFTYDTIFELSDITLATRWDNYKPTRRAIHWAGIGISNFIIILVTVVVAVVLCRNVKKDIRNYNYQVVELENSEELTWKQVSGDVFRPPAVNPMLLASLIGTGFQLFCMFAILLCLGVFGFLNPEHRNNILNIGILFYCLMGLPGGYISARLFRFFGGSNWIKITMLTALLFPGCLVFGYVIVDIILTVEKSNAATNFIDVLSLFVLWIFCTFPLILIGSFFGAKSRKIESPFDINAIPSIIPEKPWYMSYKFTTFVTGFISFCTIFIELNYVMSALWKHEIYFLATFLWISFILFTLVAAELSILVVYWNISKGDYNWWWKSFVLGASPVIYFVLYSIYYFFNLRIRRFSAMVVYFGIMALISSMAMFICGSLSTIITFYFLKKIYKAIRI